MNGSFEYTYILLTCFFIPSLYTLIHRRFLRRYNYYLINKTVLIAGIPFLILDIVAIKLGFWKFNPLFTTSWRILGLPPEEFLFFLLIPQSCLLIWVALKRYSHFYEVKQDIANHFYKFRK